MSLLKNVPITGECSARQHLLYVLVLKSNLFGSLLLMYLAIYLLSSLPFIIPITPKHLFLIQRMGTFLEFGLLLLSLFCLFTFPLKTYPQMSIININIILDASLLFYVKLNTFKKSKYSFIININETEYNLTLVWVRICIFSPSFLLNPFSQ